MLMNHTLRERCVLPLQNYCLSLAIHPEQFSPSNPSQIKPASISTPQRSLVGNGNTAVTNAAGNSDRADVGRELVVISVCAADASTIVPRNNKYTKSRSHTRNILVAVGRDLEVLELDLLGLRR